MDIREATLDDLDLLLENRLEFVCSIRDIANPEEFRAYTRTYLKEHLSDGSLLSLIAVDQGRIVSSCILCIYQTLPVPSCPKGKRGLLLNVYTLPAYRRQGLAYDLLTRLIEEARNHGVAKIQLDYTADGHPLYQKLGFEELNNEMALKL